MFIEAKYQPQVQSSEDQDIDTLLIRLGVPEDRIKPFRKALMTSFDHDNPTPEIITQRVKTFLRFKIEEKSIEP